MKKYMEVNANVSGFCYVLITIILLHCVIIPYWQTINTFGLRAVVLKSAGT